MAIVYCRRQDAIGNPFCIMVDHQTLEDDTVTIWHRDSMEQRRVKLTAVMEVITKEVALKEWLGKV